MYQELDWISGFFIYSLFWMHTSVFLYFTCTMYQELDW
jgi:hypothetical protein